MTGSALSQMIADFTGLTGIPVPVYGATLNLTAYVMSHLASDYGRFNGSRLTLSSAAFRLTGRRISMILLSLSYVITPSSDASP